MRKNPTLWQALIPILITSSLLLLAATYLDTSLHIPLLIGTITAVVVAKGLGHRFSEVQEMMVCGVSSILPVIFIFILVGALMGVWMAAGTVPAMVYYGLRIITPTTYLPLTFVLCAAVSMSIGTAFGTTSTVGIAMLGIGQALGLPLPLVVGAIVSGVYFGDRLSPLGSALNLAAAVSETELYDLMQHLFATTIMPFVVSLGAYIYLGGRVQGTLPVDQTSRFLTGLSASFQLSPWLLLPPALVILLAAFRVPAIPSLTAGATLGAIIARVCQNASWASIFTVMHTGFQSNSADPMLQQLLSRGGISSMMDVVSLLIIALAFSGVLEGTGMLDALLGGILTKLRTIPQLITGTVVVGTLVAMVAANQSLPIIVMGRSFIGRYKELKLHPKNLGRALLDSAGILCPLIPWNISGLFMSSMLGVPVTSYAPFAFFCWLMPISTLAAAWLGYRRVRPVEQQEYRRKGVAVAQQR